MMAWRWRPRRSVSVAVWARIASASAGEYTSTRVRFERGERSVAEGPAPSTSSATSQRKKVRRAFISAATVAGADVFQPVTGVGALPPVEEAGHVVAAVGDGARRQVADDAQVVAEAVEQRLEGAQVGQREDEARHPLRQPR